MSLLTEQETAAQPGPVEPTAATAAAVGADPSARAASGRRRRAKPIRRGPGWFVKEAVLTVLAVAGAACLLAVAASYFLGLSLVMFRTGSMSPTIPAGSVALVRDVPANQVQVGDVVTVARDGRLPVTHRVIAVDETRPDGSATFRMRGDANPVDDPEPYVADQVRRVEASLAGVAPSLNALGRPQVLAGVTVAVTALVTWTLWPAPATGRRRT